VEPQDHSPIREGYVKCAELIMLVLARSFTLELSSPCASLCVHDVYLVTFCRVWCSGLS
jgi:hypothetical protein